MVYVTVLPGEACTTLALFCSWMGSLAKVTEAAVGAAVALTKLSHLRPDDWVVYVPALPLVTGTVTVQLPALRLGTVRSSEVAPAARMGELVTPLQVPPMDGGEVTAKPASAS